MKYEYMKNTQIRGSVKEQILYNRDGSLCDVGSTAYPYSPLEFGEELMEQAWKLLTYHLAEGTKIGVLVDADCDGYTATALLCNYIEEAFTYYHPQLLIYMHEGKQHGLNDLYERMINDGVCLCISPDGGSYDFEAQDKLIEAGVDIIVLDHHECDSNLTPRTYKDYYAIINNQTTPYPNKDLSGVGVTWQFCRYIDMKRSTDFAEDYYDLVALGNCGDMEDFRSPETLSLIWKGFSSEEMLVNPFIKEMVAKNQFSLNKAEYKSYKGLISPMGAAFFIIPFINAVARVGTKEEKELLFFSMLEDKAYTKVPSTKRGHKPDDTETIVEQAVRQVTNVKNRQTKAETTAVEQFEKKIQQDNMLNDSALVFYVDSNTIERNIAGLVANRLANKYDRPVCILTENGEDYSGSARGNTMKGLMDFRGVCQQCPITQAQGHNNAFGLSVPKDKTQEFKDKIQTLVPSASADKIYKVDFIFQQGQDDELKDCVNEIAQMNDYWGTGLPRPRIALKNFQFKKQDINIYKKTSATIKFSTDFVSCLLFNADETLVNLLDNLKDGFVNIDLVGECVINEQMGYFSPQIKVIDYSINSQCKYSF